MNASYYRFKHVLQDGKLKEGTRLALNNAVGAQCAVWQLSLEC